jgi:hypothetical protein
MAGEFGDRQQAEDRVTEEPLPSGLKDADGGRREEALKRVDEAGLSGVVDLPHFGRNSLQRLALSLPRPLR